ncbi:hypothetical protein V6N12_061704 [Hibiscus sabdariffa]|uniref:Uncharacterized protein n=1 Tax=Hibiscus sabdariffa TaxID=183260 RepID=A0ABR2DXV1_9ROSI
MDAMSIIWHDNWIAGVGPLPMHVESFNRDTLPRVSVATMLDVHDMWNWSLFQHLLPLLVLIRIATVNELDPLFPEDTIEWSLAVTRKFSIKSAYEHRSGNLNEDSDRIWRVI